MVIFNIEHQQAMTAVLQIIANARHGCIQQTALLCLHGLDHPGGQQRQEATQERESRELDSHRKHLQLMAGAGTSASGLL